MRRFALLLAGGALWLFLAALPTLADGGPHAMAQNSGSSTLTADGCAACHRAHTAKGLYLLNDASASVSIDNYCTTCHGAGGTGATTDVMTGIQYAVGTSTVRAVSPQLGALRGGGFQQARIDSSNAVRASYLSTRGTSFVSKVGVTTPTAVTSAHIALSGVTGLEPQNKVWGNGTTGAGPVVDLECTTCHNPHGNGQYRILRPVPALSATVGTFAATNTALTSVVADDAANLAAVVSPGTDARNYTVIQANPLGGRYLLASQVAAGEPDTFTNTAGDYFHRKVPWNSISSTGTQDAPNGDATNFNSQINTWCLQCHSRYLSTGWDVNTGDPTFTYRHSQTKDKSCLTCHVAHGSNAAMNGTNTSNFPYPDGTTKTNSSRLLKVDNRGTCQLCHEPTTTVIATTGTPGAPNPITGTWPSPVVP